MSHNAQSLINSDPDLRKAVERLRRTPGVTNVVCGSFSNASHSHKPGSIKVVRKHPDHLDARVYTKRGMVNAYVYTADTVKVETDLTAGRQLPSRVPTPTPPEQPVMYFESPSITVAGAFKTAVAPANATPEPAAATPPPPAVKPPAPVAEPVTPVGEILTASSVDGSGITGSLVTITPDIAFSWLTRNTRNRALRKGVVERYSRDMRAGRWRPGGGIIKFDTAGGILNGQHTLHAVVESMATIQAFVITGLDPNVAAVEDEHSPRKLTDTVRILNPGYAVQTVTAATATMMRRSQYMWLNKGAYTMPDATRQEEIEYLMKHRDAIDFAVSCFGLRVRQGIYVAHVMAVVARASYSADHHKLHRFGRVLQTGVVDDINENTACVLRNSVLLPSVGGNLPAKIEIYRKVERALHAFLNDEVLKIIRPIAEGEELFLLPEEKEQRRRKARA